MSDEQLTRRWEYETTNHGTANAVHEVMTEATKPGETHVHVAYTASEDLAAHLVEIHNRTFGDGQDPPRLGSVMARTAYTELARDLAAGRRIEVNEGFPPEGYFSTTEAQRVQRQQRRERPPVSDLNRLPDVLRRSQMQGRTGGMEFRYQLVRLVEGEVQRRVTEYAARESGRLIIDGNPVAMANVLSKLGYKVFGPDDPVVPDDHFEQINKMRRDLGQDEAEQIPGAREAADWFDSTQLDAGKPVDNVRRAFLAGYEAARRKSADGINP